MSFKTRRMDLTDTYPSTPFPGATTGEITLSEAISLDPGLVLFDINEHKLQLTITALIRLQEALKN